MLGSRLPVFLIYLYCLVYENVHQGNRIQKGPLKIILAPKPDGS